MSKLKSIFAVSLALVFMMSASVFAAAIDGAESAVSCSHPNRGRVWYNDTPQYVLGEVYYYYSNTQHYRNDGPLYFCYTCETTFCDWDNPKKVYQAHNKGSDCSWCDGTYTYRAYMCTLCNHRYTATKFKCVGDRCPYPHRQTTSITDPSGLPMIGNAAR